MDRSRLPSLIGFILFVIRCATLLFSLSALTLAIYLSVTSSYTNPALYTALVWAVLIDNVEILGLITRRSDGIRHVSFWFLVVWEAVGFALFVISYTVAYDLRGLLREPGDSGELHNRWRARALYMKHMTQLVLLEVGFRAVLMMICAFDSGYCRVQRGGSGNDGIGRNF